VTEFLVKNATGENGHEASAKHQKFAQLYIENRELPKVELSKQEQFF